MAGGRRRTAILGLLAGLAVLSGLFLWRGVEAAAGILGQAGPALLLVCLFSLPEQVMAAEAWRVLFPANRRPGRLRMLAASWMGSAVNTLLPVATIGGELVKTRLIVLWGHAGPEPPAAMIVDKTAQAVAVLLWGLVGTGFLAALVAERELVAGILAGAGLLALGIGAFVAVQVRGGFSFVVDHLVARAGPAAAETLRHGTAAMERAIRDIYAAPGRWAPAILLRLGQRLLLAGEVVLAGLLFGLPVGLVEAVILKGVVGAVRGVSFAVPGAVGIQEGGYVAVGALLGYSPDLMIAVSLATRLREILPSLPFLVLWQVTEGRVHWPGARRPDPPDERPAP